MRGSSQPVDGERVAVFSSSMLQGTTSGTTLVQSFVLFLVVVGPASILEAHAFTVSTKLPFHPSSTCWNADTYAIPAPVSLPLPLVVRYASPQPQRDEWSVIDDWNQCSHADAAVPDSSVWFQPDYYQRAVEQLEQSGSSSTTNHAGTCERTILVLSEEDEWINQVIDVIQQQPIETTTTSGVPAGTSTNTQQEGAWEGIDFEKEMGDEIALLIRCNEIPETLLIQEGRALAPLTESERDDPRQLLRVTAPPPLSTSSSTSLDQWELTTFFRNALDRVWQEHSQTSSTSPSNGIVTKNGMIDEREEEDIRMDATNVASWMTKCLGKSIGPHDPRVTRTLSLHGTYGKGYLTRQNFHDLYVNLLTLGGQARTFDELSTTGIQMVWRDLRHHGIASYNEQEYQRQLKELPLPRRQDQADMGLDLLDECYILDDPRDKTSATTDREGKSSHETVQVASDGTTPIWIRDGEFVFIDEESCIGCMQCALAAPSSFRMVENGRFRAFAQRQSPDVVVAVSTCPVNCMHFVSFDELKELETARDHGDERDDHRHFGSSSTRGYIGRIPLHVSNRDSDAAHRQSWYHYLKNKCQTSSQCPRRGCYSCPAYAEPGMNPFFQERLRTANRIRAQYFISHGEADEFRKVAEL